MHAKDYSEVAKKDSFKVIPAYMLLLSSSSMNKMCYGLLLFPSQPLEYELGRLEEMVTSIISEMKEQVLIPMVQLDCLHFT